MQSSYLSKALPLLPKEAISAESSVEIEQSNRNADSINQQAEVWQWKSKEPSKNKNDIWSPILAWSTKSAPISTISASGSTFAVVFDQWQIGIYNLGFRTPTSFINLRTIGYSSHEEQITNLILSETGHMLGVELNLVYAPKGSYRPKLYEKFQIWDLETKMLHRTFEVQNSVNMEPTASFTFSPDGSSYVAYKEGIDIRVKFMDSGRDVTAIPPMLRMNHVKPCIIAFKGAQRIIYGSTDLPGTLFETQNLNPAEYLYQKKGVQGSRFHVFSHDLNILVYLAPKTAKRPRGSLDVVYVPRMEIRTSIPVPEDVRSEYSTVTLRISYGHRDFLAAMFDNQIIKVWDIDEGNMVASFPRVPDMIRTSICFTHYDELLVGESSLLLEHDRYAYHGRNMGTFKKKSSGTEKKFPSVEPTLGIGWGT